MPPGRRGSIRTKLGGTKLMKRAATTALVVGVAVLLGDVGSYAGGGGRPKHVSVTRSFVDTGSVTAGGELEVTIEHQSRYKGYLARWWRRCPPVSATYPGPRRWCWMRMI